MSKATNNQNDHELSSKVENTDPEGKKELLSSYNILTFRSHVPEQYKSFVFSRWLHSLRFGNDMFKLTQSDTYYAAYSKYIDAILKRDNARLRVAVLTDDPDTALGWAVDELGCLHYVYVKPEVRNLGIANALVLKIESFSHLTHIGLSIWNDKHKNLVFNPFK